MSTTTRLALPCILTQQAQKELTHAAGLNRLDALVQPVVQQVGLNTPPGSPAEGLCWIVGTAPTGAWAGQANRLTQSISGAWAFYAPFVSLVAFDAAMPAQWVWTGSAWAIVAPRLLEASVTYGPPSLAPGDGVTTTAAAAVTGAALGDFARARAFRRICRASRRPHGSRRRTRSASGSGMARRVLSISAAGRCEWSEKRIPPPR